MAYMMLNITETKKHHKGIYRTFVKNKFSCGVLSTHFFIGKRDL